MMNDVPTWVFTTTLVVLGSLGLYLLGDVQSLIGGKQSKRPRYPPMAPGGVFRILPKFWAVTVADFLLDLSRKMGKIFRVPLAPPGKHFFMVGDGVVARRILENPKTKKFLPIYSMFDSITGGPTMFTSEGPRFKHARKSTNIAFAKTNIDRMTETIHSAVQDWVEKHIGNGRDDIDVSHEMQRLTILVIGKIAFAYDFSDDEIAVMQAQIEQVFREFIIHSQKNPLRKWFPWFIPHVREAYANSRALVKTAHKIIDHYRSTPDAPTNTVLHLIMNDPEYKNDDERAADVLIYISAGYDTTSAAIGWTMLSIAQHPDIQTWLRSELCKLPPADRAVGCDALSMVIRESMRLNPSSAIGGARVLAEDIVLKDGTLMPKGSSCLILNYVIQRDGDVFEEPDRFQPSRWEKATPDMQRSWIAFSAGRRNCQGMAIANAELRVVLAKLCAEYEWTIVKEGRREVFVSMKTIGTILKAVKKQ